MKQYKLADNVISVGALGNKIFFSEDNGIYAETCWKPGEAEVLVASGFLKVHSEEPAKLEIIPPVLPDEKKEIPEEVGKVKNENSDQKEIVEPSLVRKIDDIDIKELRLYLIGKKIKFIPNTSKEELYQLYVNSF